MINLDIRDSLKHKRVGEEYSIILYNNLFIFNINLQSYQNSVLLC
jgi:hypothetical protein